MGGDPAGHVRQPTLDRLCLRQRLAEHVDERMRAISDTSKTMPLTRVAILAALNIADDLLKLREHLDQSSHLSNLKTDHLIDLIKKHVDD